jgi:hypothetical protein
VIDISEAVFSGVPEEIPLGGGAVASIKTASYGSDASAIARVLITFTKDVETDIATVGTKLVVKIQGGAAPVVAQREKAPAANQEEAKVSEEVKAEKETAKQAEQARAAQEKEAREAAAKVEQERLAQARQEAARAEQQKQEEQRRAELEKKKQSEEEQRRQAEEEKLAEKKRRQEAEDAKRQAEAENKQRQAEEARSAQLSQKDEAAAKREEETQRKQQADAERKQRAEEAWTAQQAARDQAEEAKRQAAADKKRQAEEAQTARQKAREEAAEAKLQAAAEAKQRAEERKLAKQKALEERQAQREAKRAPLAESKPVPLGRTAEGSGEVTSRRKTMTFVGFERAASASRVYVKTNEPVRYSVLQGDAKTVILELENTRIALYNNRRPLDTSFFDTAVAMVAPAPAGGRSVRVEIKLKEAVAFQARQEGNVVSVEFSPPAHRASSQ